MHSKRASPSENTVKVTDVGIKYPPPKKKKNQICYFYHGIYHFVTL